MRIFEVVQMLCSTIMIVQHFAGISQNHQSIVRIILLATIVIGF